MTLKNNRVLPLMMVINCTQLYDPAALIWFGLYPAFASFFFFFIAMLQP
jgi:hypothetical protein